MTWKDEFAETAIKALDHELVKNAESEYAFNMRPVTDLTAGLPAYGLHKVMRHVAIVSAAYALGIDPDSLRLSHEEADDAIVAQARAFAARGVPVLIVVPPEPVE